MREQVIEKILDGRVIVIVRRMYGDMILKLAEALAEGGLGLMEVTFDQADPDCLKKTGDTIRALRGRMEGRMLIGAGTVLDPQQVAAAAEAGAQYIISPNVSGAVISATRKKCLVSIPGAMTPTEMAAAHEMGADFVKVFPACDLGLGYIKNVKAPLSHIPFLATGGVNEQNLADHLRAGYVGAGVSGRLTERAVAEAGNFAEFTRRARVFADIAKAEGRA